MQIVKGKLAMPKRVVIYAPEGIGKTTLASQAPNPLFADIEGGTATMNVDRLPKASSWSMLKMQVDSLKKDSMGYQTFVLDTADWAERLCLRHICDEAEKSSIEDFGYGKGFVKAEEEWGRFLDLLTDLTQRPRMNVIVLAHSHLRKFEQPDELGAYDRYELKLFKKLSPMTKEWADCVLFVNYETFVVEDEKTKSKKAQGGKRVIHTVHHPAWDAKNRDGLPEKLPFPKEGAWSKFPKDFFFTGGVSVDSNTDQPIEQKAESKGEAKAPPKVEAAPTEEAIPGLEMPPEGIPSHLWDLMQADGVTEAEISAAVAKRGYYPAGTPIKNYEPDFIRGVLVSSWPKVIALIETMRKEA